jgi:transcription initiation factor IIE alpha subunit
MWHRSRPAAKRRPRLEVNDVERAHVSVPEDAGGGEMQAVLLLLRSIATHLTADQIANRLGYETPVVERALQRLLVRRQVVCRSHEPQGSSRICLPIWSADRHDE